MQESFIGSIFMTGANFAPYGWKLCQGQLLSIADNSALYNLLGTTYGGDGQQTFGIPDLRGRLAINQGQGPGLNSYIMGQMSGNESATMTVPTMPLHNHLINVSTNAGTTPTAANNVYISAVLSGTTPEAIYSTNPANGTLNNATIGNTAGGNLPFSIVQPVLGVNYIISLFGIYPSPN